VGWGRWALARAQVLHGGLDRRHGGEEVAVDDEAEVADIDSRLSFSIISRVAARAK